MKIIKDFTKRNNKGVGSPDWTINDIFDMLDYLSKKIEKLTIKQNAKSKNN